MAMYTVLLKDLIASGFDIGLTSEDYPIFDESHRQELNNKIIDNFATREIGAETPALFKFYLNRRMRKIMPMYNQLYESQVHAFNMLHNIDIKEVYSHNIDTTNIVGQINKNTVVGSDTSNDLSVHSATPNGSLTIENIVGEVYADDSVHSEGRGTNNQVVDSVSDTDGTTETVESYTKETNGLSGIQYADAILKWRETMLNIDRLIVENELGDLFMGLWGAQ